MRGSRNVRFHRETAPQPELRTPLCEHAPPHWGAIAKSTERDDSLASQKSGFLPSCSDLPRVLGEDLAIFNAEEDQLNQT